MKIRFKSSIHHHPAVHPYFSIDILTIFQSLLDIYECHGVVIHLNENILCWIPIFYVYTYMLELKLILYFMAELQFGVHLPKHLKKIHYLGF